MMRSHEKYVAHLYDDKLLAKNYHLQVFYTRDMYAFLSASEDG